MNYYSATWPTCFFLCLLATMASAALRVGVQVWGSSMPPGFARTEGKCETYLILLLSCYPSIRYDFMSSVAWECPSSHPFPCANGTLCASPSGSNSTHRLQEWNLQNRKRLKQSLTSILDCDGKRLFFYSSCCPADTIPCPGVSRDQSRCRENKLVGMYRASRVFGTIFPK